MEEEGEGGREGGDRVMVLLRWERKEGLERRRAASDVEV
jgi:hypothetical protein